MTFLDRGTHDRRHLRPQEHRVGEGTIAIYHRRINGREVWWVRVNYRGLSASRVCDSKEVAKDAESALREGLRRAAQTATAFEAVLSALLTTPAQASAT